jgi:putative phosphoesterase
MRIGILSDTHSTLHPHVFHHLADVELILHAGDYENPRHLDELGELAPVKAVRGNCDPHSQLIPLTLIETHYGFSIGLTHGHTIKPRGSLFFDDALVEAFVSNGVGLIVHGHTHQARLVRHASGVGILNPGAAGRPSPRAPQSSLCIVELNPLGQKQLQPQVRFVELPY